MTASDDRQPGGRAPARGPLALVQAFANSRWDLDRGLVDRWSDGAALGEWLAGHGLVASGSPVPGESDLGRALDVREGLRALALANNGRRPDPSLVERLNAALGGATLSVTLAADAPARLVAARSGLDGALGRIAAIVVAAQLDGSWERMKACPGDHCGWVFFDHSRNRAGSWCSMTVCGARHKARAYRARRRS